MSTSRTLSFLCQVFSDVSLPRQIAKISCDQFSLFDMAADGLLDTDTTHATLDLLAVRLRRLEFLLSGSSDLDGQPDGIEKPSKHDESVLGRLRSLQSSLDKLRKDSGVAGEMVRDIEALRTSQAVYAYKLRTGTNH